MSALGGPGRVSAGFVRPAFAHQTSNTAMFGMVSPPALGSSMLTNLYDKPPASPMDTTRDNNSISSTNSGKFCMKTNVMLFMDFGRLVNYILSASF